MNYNQSLKYKGIYSDVKLKLDFSMGKPHFDYFDICKRLNNVLEKQNEKKSLQLLKDEIPEEHTIKDNNSINNINKILVRNSCDLKFVGGKMGSSEKHIN